MGSELPKQFLPIGGKPVLMHTLQAFYDYDREMRIILVLPASQQVYWAQLCREHHLLCLTKWPMAEKPVFIL